MAPPTAQGDRGWAGAGGGHPKWVYGVVSFGKFKAENVYFNESISGRNRRQEIGLV